MLDLYYKDFSKNKEGTWGIEPNRLIRFDLEGNQLYFYDFKEHTFGMTFLSSILNAIVDPLRFVLVDEGQVMPISLFERYKFYGKITTEYYHVRNQLELKRNAEAIRSLVKTKKKQSTSKFQSRLNDMANHNNLRSSRNNISDTINSHSGNVTDLDKLNDKIIRLMKENEERVRRGY